ncbi:regulatory protein RecX [Runella aurantiaca]|uniref:Regulatory protein RecX n=1 Tax=Runella aurantiaca TaxID=2282308 RepID=A0A369I4X2_9BACT|nr:regulatory protein RecX [Runella aurantiaca]RDB04092.1 RecX family transcriptional regulator [Runella aurantiaca]
MTDRQKFALLKAASFCAYQERTVKETRQRLNDWELSEEETAWVLEELKAQNYLNEERFARAFAGGKFRVKRWGRLKIRQEMKIKGLPNDLIQKGLGEIDGDDYEAVLRDLLEKKAKGLKGEPLAIKQKLVRFALSRGFESDIVWELLKTMGVEEEQEE